MTAESLRARQAIALVLVAPIVARLALGAHFDEISTHQAAVAGAVAVGVAVLPNVTPVLVVAYCVVLYSLAGFSDDAVAVMLRTDIGGETLPTSEAVTVGGLSPKASFMVTAIGGGAFIAFVAIRVPWAIFPLMVAMSGLLAVDCLSMIGHAPEAAEPIAFLLTPNQTTT